MDNITIAVFALILVAAGAGFYRQQSLSPQVVRFFPYFLIIQFGYQFFSVIYSFLITSNENNHLVFNLFMVFNIIYFGLFFHGIIESAAKKLIIIIATSVNILFYAANLLFLQGALYLMTYSRTLMGVFVVLCCLMYFHQLIASEETNPVNPTRNAIFWIVTALFFFYLCSTLTLSLWNYLSLGREWHIGPSLMRFFVFLLYGMYLVGFLLHKPIKRSIHE